MELQINAIHFDIAEKLNDFINKKVEKLTRRYPSVLNIEVNLRVVKPETAMNKEARVITQVPKENDVVATKTADSFEEAVDLALEAIERQLERDKAKKA